MTHFRIIDNIETSPEELALLIDSLPHWRREEALRYKHQKGRRECCLSYLLLCEMLCQHFSIDIQPLFVKGEHGKPQLEIEGRNINFNISHCKHAIACIVSDSEEVGIDIECTGRYKESLAAYSMSTQECERIKNAICPDTEFTKLWTQKEALLKMTGEGITDDLKTVLQSNRMQGTNIETHVSKDANYVCSIATTKAMSYEL